MVLGISFPWFVRRIRLNYFQAYFISDAKFSLFNPPHMLSRRTNKPAHCQRELVPTTAAHVINNRTENYITLPETCCTKLSAVQMHLEGFHLAI